MVRDAVWSEPVSPPISLLNGNLQGNRPFQASSSADFTVKNHGFLPFCSTFLYAQNREFYGVEQGMISGESGIEQAAIRAGGESRSVPATILGLVVLIGHLGVEEQHRTCEPTPLVAPIHPKAMPVILAPEDEDRWLRDPYATACELAQPFPSQLMAVADGSLRVGALGVRQQDDRAARRRRSDPRRN